MTESEIEKETVEETFYMHSGQVLEETFQKEEGKRIFKGILSGEVVDKEGDLIPIEEFAKFFKTLIRRQTPFLLKHQPIHVGKIISLEKTTFERIPAVIVEGEIFKDFPKDDETWQGILNGKYFGMSFTGEVEQTIIKCDSNKCHKERKLSAIYELTITDSPANQVSKITEYLTKEYEVKKMTEAEPEIKKDESKEEKPLNPSLSKENLQAEFKTLGEGLNSTIKEGFEGLTKSLSKETIKEEEVETPVDPVEEEEDEMEADDQKTEPVSKETELKWEDIQEKFSDKIEELIAKSLKDKISSVETPSSGGDTPETPVIETAYGLPPQSELMAKYRR